MSFDRLAPHYNWLERLTGGSRLQRARAHGLDALSGCRDVLSVGEGHGRFAAAFLARFPEARLTCVESSPRMMAVGQERTRAWADRIRWDRVDILSRAPDPGRHDAIVTCFVLDCFPQDTLARVVRKLAESATETCVWLNVDFAIPPSGPKRWRAQAIHALMYGFFRIATHLPARRLHPPDELLTENRFALTHRKEFEWGLIRADIWKRPEPNLTAEDANHLTAENAKNA